MNRSIMVVYWTCKTIGHPICF